MSKKPLESKTIADNRRARFDYAIEDTIEAGMVLLGSEVKSLRVGGASLSDAYADQREDHIVLYNLHIPEYKPANRFNHEPKRARQLLLKKREYERLIGAIRRDGYTLVPLSLFFNKRGIAKCLLGLAKGKNKADKRESIRTRETNREISRAMKKDF